MIEINNLYKSFGRSKVLEDLNLKLEEGKIYGLLGRNGVGKTTLLNIIGNQIRKSQGQIKVFGEEIFENPKVVEEVALVRENRYLAEDTKLRDIFKAGKDLYKDWDEEFKEYLVDEFNLRPNIRKKFIKLSKGNQTLVGLIVGLASRARLTIFDEPSLGLDAANRYKFYQLLLKDIENHPRSIIISTHLIDEVANLFEQVIILKDKKVYLHEDIESLQEKSYFLNGRDSIIKSIIGLDNIIYEEAFGNSSIIGIYKDLKDIEKDKLRENNIEISKIPLQKLFIYLTEGDYNG